jgi:hypothetical protein
MTCVSFLSVCMISQFLLCQAHIKCQPFEESSEDHLQSLSLISTVMILVLGIMIKAAEAFIKPICVKTDHPKLGGGCRGGRHLPTLRVKSMIGRLLG